jgi:hypothetical protein
MTESIYFSTGKRKNFAVARCVNAIAASAGMTILKVEKKQSAGVGMTRKKTS